MTLLLIILFIALLTAAIIYLLHSKEVHSREEMIDRSTPLGTLDLEFGEPHSELEAESKSSTQETPQVSEPAPRIPDSISETTEDTPVNWLEQVKLLREKKHFPPALTLCEHHFPRIQAFQQAALILRQQVKTLIEEHKSASAELTKMYRIAVMADLYRSSNPHKPLKPAKTLESLQDLEFEYAQIGSRHLRLLTKNDILHMEQLWGKPKAHQHADIALGESWLALCK